MSATLPPGPEIDAAVGRAIGLNHSTVPPYSSDVGAAIEALTRLNPLHYTIEYSRPSYAYEVTLFQPPFGSQFMCTDASLPLAICRAILVAASSSVGPP